jgi:hypothetical protein
MFRSIETAGMGVSLKKGIGASRDNARTNISLSAGFSKKDEKSGENGLDQPHDQYLRTNEQQCQRRYRPGRE